jgi:hypothetical protein
MSCTNVTQANTYWTNSACNNDGTFASGAAQGASNEVDNKDNFDAIEQMLYLLVSMFACLRKIAKEQSLAALDRQITSLTHKCSAIKEETKSNVAAERTKAITSIVTGAVDSGFGAMSIKHQATSSRDRTQSECAKFESDRLSQGAGIDRCRQRQAIEANDEFQAGIHEYEASQASRNAGAQIDQYETYKGRADTAERSANGCTIAGKASSLLGTGGAGVVAAEYEDQAGSHRQTQVTEDKNKVSADYDESNASENKRAAEEQARATNETFDKMAQAKNAGDKAAWTVS